MIDYQGGEEMKVVEDGGWLDRVTTITYPFVVVYLATTATQQPS